MKKYIEINKRSKKAKKEFYSSQRLTWGNTNPATKVMSDKKTYNRKKEKNKISKEFKNEFDADFLYYKIKICLFFFTF